MPSTLAQRPLRFGCKTVARDKLRKTNKHVTSALHALEQVPLRQRRPASGRRFTGAVCCRARRTASSSKPRESATNRSSWTRFVQRVGGTYFAPTTISRPPKSVTLATGTCSGLLLGRLALLFFLLLTAGFALVLFSHSGVVQQRDEALWRQCPIPSGTAFAWWGEQRLRTQRATRARVRRSRCDTQAGRGDLHSSRHRRRPLEKWVLWAWRPGGRRA